MLLIRSVLARIKLPKTAMRNYIFTVKVIHEEDGRWSALIPDLPGCATWGHTKEEAIENLKIEAAAFLKVMSKKRQLPPTDDKPRYFEKAGILALSV